jgi:hypothetical protein
MALPRLRPPIVRIPRVTNPVPSEGPRPAPRTPARDLRRKVSRLRKRYQQLEGSFYDFAVELRTLNKPEVLRLFQAATFTEFIEDNIMPVSTAHRWMQVSKAYTKPVALKLGIYRAYHLLRYTKVKGLRATAQELAARDAKIGSPPKRISEYSGRQLQLLVTQARLQAGRDAIPGITRVQQQAVKRFKRTFEDRFGFAPKSRINMKRGVVEFEVPMDELA